MSHPYDATLKSIVAEHPGDFTALFGLPATSPITVINVDLSTLSAASDVVLAYGDPIETIVDLNFQSGPDPALSRRLHLYNAALNYHHDVPVRSILVLLRQKADAKNLNGTLAYGTNWSRVEFGYEVIRLWEQPVESCLHSGLATLPLATLCRLPKDQPVPAALHEVVLEIDRRLSREATDASAAVLMKAAYILTGLRADRLDLPSIYRGTRIMSEMTAWDEWIEAEHRGAMNMAQRTILRQGRHRFGDLDPDVETSLKSIQDVDRLERMTDAILTAKSWDELLSTP